MGVSRYAGYSVGYGGRVCQLCDVMWVCAGYSVRYRGGFCELCEVTWVCLGIMQDTVLDTEAEFVTCVKRLSECQWNSADLLPSDLSLLHLAAALGMAQLITALIKWRSDVYAALLH